MLTLVVAVVASMGPCELPAGVTLEAQLRQVLFKAAAAPELPEVSPQLAPLLQQARALRLSGTSKAKLLATLTQRLDLLEQVSSLCGEQLEPRLAAVRVMVALTQWCGDPHFFVALNRTVPAARALAFAFPASAAAHQAFASALDLAEKWGATPERKWAAAREKKLALENCRELDPAAPCSTPP
ncbi:MAG: hypothetical protein Q8L48_36725 [Archangium sp.]|nr:hypothetical protein [Archangium sp.]